MEWFLASALLILLASILLGLRRLLARPRLRCPNCGGAKVGLITKDPQGVRSVDMHTGGMGGGYSGIQTAFVTTYQCNDCHFRWTTSTTETT